MTRRVNFDALFRERDLLFYYSTFHTDRERLLFPADSLDYLHELLIHDYVVIFRDGPQLYHDGLIFPGKALISLCISDERLKEKNDAVADSLYRAWYPKTHQDSLICYKVARTILERQPERFEELRGEGIPTCRNTRIEQIQIERIIRADRNWSFLLNAKAKNDSLDVRDLFKKESFNAMHWQPLLRDNTFFTTYDYFGFLIDEASLEIQRSQTASAAEADIFQQALDTIKTRIRRHAFDNDTLMIMACKMNAIVNELGKENSLASIREKAEDWNVSIDKAFRMAAVWCYHHSKDQQKNISEETIIKAVEDYQIEHRMRQSQESLDDLTRKHHDLDLPLRLIINRNIEWIRQTRI